METRIKSAPQRISRAALLHHLDTIEAAADALALIAEADPDDPRARAFRLVLAALLTSARQARGMLAR